MKLLRVDFDDTGDLPMTAQFEMTVPEMVLLYNFVGTTAPSDVEAVANGASEYGSALNQIADCLAGQFFNRFWEDGWRDAGITFTFDQLAEARRLRKSATQ